MYTEKVRVYPNKNQRKLIDQFLYEAKELYNYLLYCYTDMYESTGIICNKYELFDLAKNFDKSKSIPALAKRGVATRLHDAFIRFFNKQNQFPNINH